MNKELKKLQKQEVKIKNRIYGIKQTEIRKIQIPRLKTMIGQCFIYKGNSYSCPEKTKDYWDVFRKILEGYENNHGGFNFIIEEFSIDRDGKINWTVEIAYAYLDEDWWDKTSPFTGFEKITQEEYNIEKAKMINEMTLRTKIKYENPPR